MPHDEDSQRHCNRAPGAMDAALVSRLFVLSALVASVSFAQTLTKAPTLVKAVEPEFPASALDAGVGAQVVMDIDIGPDGTVTEAKVVQSAGAAFVVDRRATAERARPARAAIIAQWVLNMSWTPLYFGLRNVPNGFYVTVAAWVLCLVTLTVTVRAAKLAAALLAPLFGWLTFALALSWTTWQLNP